MTFLFYLWSMKQNSATWIRFRNKEEASCYTKKQRTVQITYRILLTRWTVYISNTTRFDYKNIMHL